MRDFEDIGSKGHFSAEKGFFWVKPPPRGNHKKILAQNNIKNEFSTIKLLRVQIFSKIWQLLKNHYHRGGFFYIFGGKKAPQGGTRIF